MLGSGVALMLATTPAVQDATGWDLAWLLTKFALYAALIVVMAWIGGKYDAARERKRLEQRRRMEAKGPR